MKHRVIVVNFNRLLSIKESYLIATAGQKNPFVILRFIEAILTIMNPVTPHFCQHVWQSTVLPIVKQSTGKAKEPTDFLLHNGWPESAAYDSHQATVLKYLETIKREIRLALDKSKQGGGKKKKGKGAAQAEPEAPKESCIIAIGSEFPEFQQKVLQVLQASNWNEDGTIVGKDYIDQVRAVVTDKKQAGLAMKFAGFTIDQVKKEGKEQALLL